MDNKINFLELKKKAATFKPSELVDVGFNESLKIALGMLNNEEWDETLQTYAVDLFEEIRKKYSNRWNSSWKYDALLGYAYHITLKYEERYEAYKRALSKINPCPPQLLIAFAQCCIAPGKPPISEEDAILLVKEAIKTTPYIEGIQLLRGLYKSVGNLKEQQYWESVLEKLGENGPHLPSLDDI